MSRYNVSKSKERENGWVCEDSETGFAFVFNHKKFNDTVKTYVPEGTEPDALVIARINREMSDWLMENHWDKLY